VLTEAFVISALGKFALSSATRRRALAASRLVSCPTRAGVPALAALLLGCGGSELRMSSAPPPSTYVESFDGKPTDDVDLGRVRLRPDACRDIDLRPVERPLDSDDFVAFLKGQGAETRIVRARQDLVFVELLNAGTAAPIRFRVAVLSSPAAAGNELHTALLQHGKGTWGLHRGNLAVLGPQGTPDDIVVMAGRFHLACWGVLMIAGHDDTFVVPGGYTEL
jgi:hypothetical protein